MAPAPNQAHQDISGELFYQLKTFLRDKPCKVFHPQFEVCLFAEGDGERTVVQPDVFVVCDLTKLDGKRCNGAPDFVVEVLSPSSASRDTLLKYNKYMQAGVREYWIIDPVDKYVRVSVLKEGKFDTIDYINPEVLPVKALEGCTIDIRRAFAEAEAGVNVEFKTEKGFDTP
jgi:Uma2 family endonuclease